MLKLLFFLLSTYLVLIVFLYLAQRKLMYFPDNFSPSPQEAHLIGMKVVTLQTNDGLKLKAWYKPPHPLKLPFLIYFHGNAGNITHRSAIIKPFLKEEYGVLLVTYRGYSQNPGSPNEEGLYEDARAALNFVLHQGIPLSCIVLYGESIGTAVAIQMATEYQVGGLILQSPFTSLTDIAQFHYPFFPVKWLLKDQFNAIQKISQIQSPALIIYAKKDKIIPPKFSLSLFKAISTKKYIESFPEMGHNDYFNSKPAINFLKKEIKCRDN